MGRLTDESEIMCLHGCTDTCCNTGIFSSVFILDTLMLRYKSFVLTGYPGNTDPREHSQTTVV